MNDVLTMSCFFGKEQTPIIDGLITEMEAEGKILSINRKEASESHVHYLIEFKNVHDAYLFGHRHGNRDVFKSLTKGFRS